MFRDRYRESEKSACMLRDKKNCECKTILLSIFCGFFNYFIFNYDFFDITKIHVNVSPVFRDR